MGIRKWIEGAALAGMLTVAGERALAKTPPKHGKQPESVVVENAQTRVKDGELQRAEKIKKVNDRIELELLKHDLEETEDLKLLRLMLKLYERERVFEQMLDEVTDEMMTEDMGSPLRGEKQTSSKGGKISPVFKDRLRAIKLLHDGTQHQIEQLDKILFGETSS